MNKNVNMTVIAVSVALALTACGGGGGSGGPNVVPPPMPPKPSVPDTPPGGGQGNPGAGQNVPGNPGQGGGSGSGGSAQQPGQGAGSGSGGQGGQAGGGAYVPPVKPTTVPVLSKNPADGDSKEAAAPVAPTSNRFQNNRFGTPNTQADSLNLKEAYDQGLSGEGVSLGMADSVIKAQHPGLPAGVKQSGPFADAAPNTNHGTGVALAMTGADVNGNVLGIAKGATLYAAAVSNGETVNRTDSVRGMNSLHNAGARIINASLGTSGEKAFQQDAKNYLAAQNKSTTFYGQLKRLTDNGALLVFAAGNDGQTHPNSEVLAPLVESDLQRGLIGVVGVNGNHQINANSNRCGDAKNWCMSAFWRFNTVNVNANDRDQMEKFGLSQGSGTSFAAPQVSAAAALVSQKYPWMNNDNLRTTLLTTASDLGAKGVDSVYGWGLLNIGKAVNGPAQFAFGDFTANVEQGAYEFSNGITGNGGLVKQGFGNLTLSADNTYTGATRVEAGNLTLKGRNASAITVGEKGSLTVSGTAGSVANNGHFHSDNATITGDYRQGAYGTLHTELGSVTRVGGKAELDGTLNISGIRQGFQGSGVRDVLTANAVSGSFKNLTHAKTLLLEATPEYTADKVRLNVKRADTVAAAQNAGLNGAALVGAAHAEKVFARLENVALDPSVNQAAAALQSITSAEQLGRSLYTLSGAVYANAATVAGIEQDGINSRFQDNLTRPGMLAEYRRNSGEWEDAGMKGEHDADTAMIGGVYDLNGWHLGAAYAYQNSNWKESTARSDIDGHGLQLGLYRDFGPVYGKATLAYTRFKGDANRVLDFGNYSEQVEGRLKADLWQTSLAVGRRFAFDRFSLTPEAGLRYSLWKQSALNETGSGFAFRHNGADDGILTLTGKVNARYDFDQAFVNGQLGVEHDGKRRNLSAGGSWNMPRTRVQAAIAAGTKVGHNAAVSLGYRYTGNGKINQHGGELNFKMQF